MKMITHEEALALIEESTIEPPELRKDVTDRQRVLFASLVRRGYMREIEYPAHLDGWYYVTWEVTPYGWLALHCYRAAMALG